MAVFRADADKFYMAQQFLIDSYNLLKEKRTNISECTSSYPRGYEYKSEVAEVCNTITDIITDIARLERNVSETKEKLMSMMSGWSAKYFETAINNYANFESTLKLGEDYVSYINEQYNGAEYTQQLKTYYDILSSSGEFTGSFEQFKVIFEYQKDKEELSQLEKELEKLYDNPVKMPSMPGGRITESQAKAYKEATEKYYGYKKRVKELEEKIEGLQINVHGFELSSECAGLTAEELKEKRKELEDKKMNPFFELFASDKKKTEQKELTIKINLYNQLISNRENYEFEKWYKKCLEDPEFQKKVAEGKEITKNRDANGMANVNAYEKEHVLYGFADSWAYEEYMTQEQIDVYYYVLATNNTYDGIGLWEGYEAGCDYLKHFEASVNQAWGEELGANQKAAYEKANWVGKTFMTLGISGQQGLSSFFEGVNIATEKMMGFEDVSTTVGYDEVAAGIFRENLEGGMGFVYDVNQVNMHMLPSMALGSIGGPVGQVASTVSIFSSSYGNKYKEMINQGYSDSQASDYAMLSAASETVLEKAFSAVPGIGIGAGTPQSSYKALLADRAKDLLVDAGGEVLQDTASKYIGNKLLNQDNDLNLFTEENLNTFLISLASSVSLGGGSTISNAVDIHNTKADISSYVYSATGAEVSYNQLVEQVKNGNANNLYQGLSIIHESAMPKILSTIDSSVVNEMVSNLSNKKAGNIADVFGMSNMNTIMSNLSSENINKVIKNMDSNTLQTIYPSLSNDVQNIIQESVDNKLLDKKLGEVKNIQYTKTNRISQTAQVVKKTVNDIKNNLSLAAINLSTNPTVNNLLTNPNVANILASSDGQSMAFLGLMTDLLYKKRAVQKVTNNVDFTHKIMNEGMLHFTPNEQVADAIIDSSLLKAKSLKFNLAHPISTAKNNLEYFANQGKKTFLFAGIPSIEEALLNLEIQPTMVGIRVKPTESQLDNIGYRHLDDKVLIHNGDLDLSQSENLEKVYVGLKYNEKDGLHYEEITKNEYENYKLEVDSATVKRITGKWSGILEKVKAQLQLSYGNIINQNNILDENFMNQQNINQQILNKNTEIEVVTTDQTVQEEKTKLFSAKDFAMVLPDIGINIFNLIGRKSLGSNLTAKQNQQVLNKIKEEGIVHITSEESAGLILDSNYVKKTKAGIQSYGAAKSFFFAGTPTIEGVAFNLDKLKTVMTGVRIRPTDAQMNDLKVRFSDGSIFNKGDFNFESGQAEQVYFGLTFEDGNLVYKEISAEQAQNYQPDVTPEQLKILQNKWALGLKTFISGMKADRDKLISDIQKYKGQPVYNEVTKQLGTVETNTKYADDNVLIDGISCHMIMPELLIETLNNKGLTNIFTNQNGVYVLNEVDANTKYEVLNTIANFVSNDVGQMVLDNESALDAWSTGVGKDVTSRGNMAEFLYNQGKVEQANTMLANLITKVNDFRQNLMNGNIEQQTQIETLNVEENVEVLEVDESKVSNEEFINSLPINQDVKNFLLANNIDVQTILKNPESVMQDNTLANGEYDITFADSDFVSIADIVGMEAGLGANGKNIIMLLNECFNSKGDAIQSRSMGMLDYDINTILNGLMESFTSQPINLAETTDGNYVINNNGRHRFLLMKALYLHEKTMTTTPEQIQALKEKYTIPVQVERVDVNRSSCRYLLEEIISDYIVTRSDYGVKVYDKTTKTTTIYEINDAINLVRDAIASMSEEEINNILKWAPKYIDGFIQENNLLGNDFQQESNMEPLEILDVEEKTEISMNQKKDLNSYTHFNSETDFMSAVDLIGILNGTSNSIKIGNATIEYANIDAIRSELTRIGITVENVSNLSNQQINDLCDMLSFYTVKVAGYDYVMDEAVSLKESYQDKVNNLDKGSTLDKVNLFSQYVVDLSNLLIKNNNLNIEINEIIQNKKVVTESSLNEIDNSWTREEKQTIVSFLQKTNYLQDLSVLSELDYSDKLLLQKYLQSGAAKTLLNMNYNQWLSFDYFGGGNFYNVNNYLQTGKDVSSTFNGKMMSEIVSDIETIMNENKFDKTYILQRGTNESEFDGISLDSIVGKILCQNRLKSTCNDSIESIGTEYGGMGLYRDLDKQKVKIDYICPKGTKAVNLGMIIGNDVESEVLLGNNQRIRYDAVKMDGDTACVLAVVLPDSVSDNVDIKDLVDAETYELISSRYDLSGNTEIVETLEIDDQIEMPKLATDNIDISAVEIIDTKDLDIDTISIFGDRTFDVNKTYEGYDYVIRAEGNIAQALDKIDFGMFNTYLLEVSSLSDINSELLSKLPSNIDVRIIGGYTVDYMNTLKSPNGTQTRQQATYTIKELQEIMDKVSKFEEGIDKNWNDYEKSLYAYNYLRDNIKYVANPGSTNARGKQFDGLMSLVAEESTCIGFAYTYKELLNRMGIQCDVVSGSLDGVGQHGYNVVTINGKSFLVDTVKESLSTNDGTTGFGVENYQHYIPKSENAYIQETVNATNLDIDENLKNVILYGKDFSRALIDKTYDYWNVNRENFSEEANIIMEKIKNGESITELDAFILVCNDQSKIDAYKEMYEIKERVKDGQITKSDLILLCDKIGFDSVIKERIINVFENKGLIKEDVFIENNGSYLDSKFLNDINFDLNTNIGRIFKHCFLDFTPQDEYSKIILDSKNKLIDLANQGFIVNDDLNYIFKNIKHVNPNIVFDRSVAIPMWDDKKIKIPAYYVKLLDMALPHELSHCFFDLYMASEITKELPQFKKDLLLQVQTKIRNNPEKLQSFISEFTIEYEKLKKEALESYEKIKLSVNAEADSVVDALFDNKDYSAIDGIFIECLNRTSLSKEKVIQITKQLNEYTSDREKVKLIVHMSQENNYVLNYIENRMSKFDDKGDYRKMSSVLDSLFRGEIKECLFHHDDNYWEGDTAAKSYDELLADYVTLLANNRNDLINKLKDFIGNELFDCFEQDLSKLAKIIQEKSVR